MSLENLNPSQSDQSDTREMPGVRRSTGEQEAPEEQQEEFQVLWEAGEHPQGSQDSRAHLQAGLCSCWHRGELLGWIPSAGALWEAQGRMELTWDG